MNGWGSLLLLAGVVVCVFAAVVLMGEHVAGQVEAL